MRLVRQNRGSSFWRAAFFRFMEAVSWTLGQARRRPRHATLDTQKPEKYAKLVSRIGRKVCYVRLQNALFYRTRRAPESEMLRKNVLLKNGVRSAKYFKISDFGASATLKLDSITPRGRHICKRGEGERSFVFRIFGASPALLCEVS